MPENFKALAVVLVLASTVFAFARKPLSTILPSGEFERRRNLWFGITVLGFMSYNIWIFIILTGILLILVSWNDKNPVSLVFFVVLAYPPIPVEIPGFGGIRFLFDIDYLKLISLAVLFPAFASEMSKHPLKSFFGEMSDKFLVSYLTLSVLLVSYLSTVTGLVRLVFLSFVDAVLPYLIASRLIKNDISMKWAIASYIGGASVVAIVGIFEFSRKWLLYNPSFLGVKPLRGIYLFRDDSLRAISSAGGPIVLGYTMAIAFCLMLSLRRVFPKKAVWLAGLALLAMGMFSSFSRGPWFGCLAGLIVFALLDPQKRFFRYIFMVALVSPVLLLTPLGDTVQYALTTESGSYDYRQRILEVSYGVILANPFFGQSSAYSPAMEELRQGQGIIDIVNTYVGIALKSGLVGLSLFVGFFGAALFGIWRRMRRLTDKESVEYDTGRGLLAALTCIMVTIFTVSPIYVIPTLYYLLVGLAVAYARIGNVVDETLINRQNLRASSDFPPNRTGVAAR